MSELEDWEAQGRRIDTPGGEVWMLDVPSGDGRADATPMLVLHGFPSCSYDWRHVLPALSEERRVVLFDFIGFGLSDKPDVRYSIRGYADTAEAVAAAAGFRQVVLVSHDLGDSVGGELLARDLAGDLGFGVERRVLTNGSIYLDLAQLTDGQQGLLALPDERTTLTSGPAFRAGLAATFSPHHPASDAEMDAQWAFTSRLDGHTLLTRTIRYIEDRRAEESRFTGAIEAHPSPLAVIWGRLDPIARAPMVDRLVERRPDATVTWLDDVAHYPMVEAPEAFAAAVQQHLA
ncbi:MAG: Epoxide hydrolase [Acidimicrobiales bacterium]|nr:Epoxide hydrolase [Acidimicrobiales bacterium]